MVEINPLRGHHYDFANLGIAPEKLLAPPYDVISDELRKSLASEPLNICNVLLGNRDDSYKHAADVFQKWLKSGKIVRDPEPCYYAYEQTFKLEGRVYQRTGIIGLLHLGPMGKGVLPHEKTHPKATEDRLQLLSSIKANIEQIFLVYDDRSNSLLPILERIKQPSNELLSFTDFDDVRHRVFRICRESDIEAITKSMAGKKVLVADGHHRYETALRYSEQMDEKLGKGTHDYVLVTLINSRDPGLIMLPTNRLIHSLPQAKLDSLQKKLSKRFEIMPVNDKASLMGALEGREGCVVIGFWFPKRRSGFIASLKPEFCSKDPVDKLEVSILHRFVIEEALGITQEMQERKEKIEFVKGTEESFKVAEKGGYQLLCLLTPSSIPEIMEAAETGRKLPHKSTYFFPKMWSGLVMYVHGN